MGVATGGADGRAVNDGAGCRAISLVVDNFSEGGVRTQQNGILRF